MSDQPVHDLYENMDDEAKAAAARNASSVEAALRGHHHATAWVTERFGEDLCRQKLHNMLKTFGASTPLSAEPTDEELKRRRHSMKCLEMTLVGVLEAEVFTDAIWADNEFLWPRHQDADAGVSTAIKDSRPPVECDEAMMVELHEAVVKVIGAGEWLDSTVDGMVWEFVQAYTELPHPEIIDEDTMKVISGPLRELEMHVDYERLRFAHSVFSFSTLIAGQLQTLRRLETKLIQKLEEAGI